MGMPKEDIAFFVSQSAASLNSFIVPAWTKVTDQRQAIFRYWSSMEHKLIEGNFESKSVSIGDKFKVIVKFVPVVSLDGNILVEFGKSTPRVIRDCEGRQSAITGLSAWLKIRSAKMAIEPKDRLVLEVTSVFECTNLYPQNMYKIIEQPICKQFKF